MIFLQSASVSAFVSSSPLATYRTASPALTGTTASRSKRNTAAAAVSMRRPFLWGRFVFSMMSSSGSVPHAEEPAAVFHRLLPSARQRTGRHETLRMQPLSAAYPPHGRKHSVILPEYFLQSYAHHNRTKPERCDDMHGGAVIRCRLYPFIVGYNAENSLIEISSYMQRAHKK